MSSLLTSAYKICNNSTQALVYGFRYCKYKSIKDTLIEQSSKLATDLNSFFLKIFDYQIGNPLRSDYNIEGLEIDKIDFDRPSNRIPRTCKSALVDIVFENYKRKKTGKEIIPVLFCIDVSGNIAPFSVTAETLASKNSHFNDLCTFKELRRAYKLCKEFDDEEIRAVAEETFKFVKVNVKDDEEGWSNFEKGNVDDCVLEQIKAPWDDPKWMSAWTKRQETVESSSRKTLSWRAQLARLKSKFLEPVQSYSSSSQTCSSSSSSSSSSNNSSLSSSLSFAIPVDQIPLAIDSEALLSSPVLSIDTSSSSDDETESSKSIDLFIDCSDFQLAPEKIEVSPSQLNSCPQESQQV